METLLTRKKQLLEDITKKQILTNRWKLEERERQEFEKALGWSKFSKEDTTRMELGEIRQRTVTGLTLKEILPQGEYPKRVIQVEKDPHLQVTLLVHGTHTVDTDGRPTPRPAPEHPRRPDRRKRDSHESGPPLGGGRPRLRFQPRTMGPRISPTSPATRGIKRIRDQTGHNENHHHQYH